MSNTRGRRVLLKAAFLVACAAGLLGAGPGAAQDWPTRNVTVVVPLGPGSASDIMARVMADQLGRQLGQTFVVENRPGAGGTIGAGLVAKAPADGYTILAYGALGSAQALHARLPYDTLNDFVPVIAFGQQPLMVVVSAAKPYKTLAELVADAKAKPGGMNYSSAGVGSASHFGAERFRVAAGFQAQHIPFRGAAEAVNEVLSGRADFSVQIATTTISLIREGKLRALGVMSTKRTALLPDVPTFVEAGQTERAIYPFYSGFFMPAKTPRPVVEKLHNEATKALQASTVQERFKTLGVEPLPMTLAQFDKFFRDDVAAAVQLVKDANIQQAQ
jgi:tripartite-type tricarboxylate transporter receptor subunit TctC